MRLSIKGLPELRARLAQVRPEEIMAAALADQAERMAQSIRDSLSEPQGTGDHDKPWARTGALRDSIAVTTDGLQAAIGSNDPAAAPQEMGTSRLPPRPFLAPTSAAMGKMVAQAIGSQLARALSGDDSPSAALINATGEASSNSTIATSPARPATAAQATYPAASVRTEEKFLAVTPDPAKPGSDPLQLVDNGRENRQFRDVVVALGLNKSQAQQLHREISGQGYGYHEILQIGIDMFGQ